LLLTANNSTKLQMILKFMKVENNVVSNELNFSRIIQKRSCRDDVENNFKLVL